MVRIRSRTDLFAAADAATTESRYAQLKVPSVVSISLQVVRILIPSTSGLPKTSLGGSLPLVMEKTPRGTWEKAFPGIASSPAAQSSTPSKAGILKGRLPACLRCATCQGELGGLFKIINKRGILFAVIKTNARLFYRNLLRLQNRHIEPFSCCGTHERDCTSAPGRKILPTHVQQHVQARDR